MTLSLCLPAASFITGATIPVDGGLMARNAWNRLQSTNRPRGSGGRDDARHHDRSDTALTAETRWLASRAGLSIPDDAPSRRCCWATRTSSA